MYENLAELCGYYSQDFDLLYKQDTDPIDLYCANHNMEIARALLGEMEDFYRHAQTGERALPDLEKMGLEWLPGGDETSFEWFREAIDYLRAKIDAGPAEGGKG